MRLRLTFYDECMSDGVSVIELEDRAEHVMDTDYGPFTSALL